MYNYMNHRMLYSLILLYNILLPHSTIPRSYMKYIYNLNYKPYLNIR